MQRLSGFRARRARNARRIMVVGGLVLASTFFMPAVTGCNTVIPAREFWDLFADDSDFALYDVINGYLLFFAAYLLGALVAIWALARLRGFSKGARIATVFVGVNLLTIAVLLAGALVESLPDPASDLGEVVVLAIFAATLVCFGVGFRLKELRGLQHQLLGLVVVMIWFAWFAVGGGLYGLYVSLTSTVLLLLATVLEASAMSGRSMGKTVIGLLLCRLRVVPDEGFRCPGCDYLLYGLAKRRCPECGRPFSFEEFGATPADMGFVGDGRTEKAPSP